MATVHRAHDLILDRDVAVKVFRHDVAEASDSRRIEAEMKMLGSVNHPSLVTLHDASVSDDGSTAFLVMELIDGTHLAKLIAERAISHDDTAEIIAQVAGGLSHIHRKGIVHRDVKPANILVRWDEDGRVHAKLADLGIAHVADSTRHTTAGTILGTVAYLSPEQVNGGDISPAADVYALGLVLLECITGRRPFPGTPAESAAIRTMQPPLVPAEIDPEYETLLASMTRIDPVSRISAADVEATLRMGRAETGRTKFLSRESLATAPTSPAQTGPAATALGTPHDAPATTGTEPSQTHPFAPETAQSRTRRLVPTDTAATQADVAPEPTAAAAPVSRPRRRGAAIAIVVLVVIVATAAVIFIYLQNTATGGAEPTTEYPTISGELGTLLEDLQRSVEQ